MRLSYISSFDPYPSCLSAFKTELQEVRIEISPYEMNHLSQSNSENPTSLRKTRGRITTRERPKDIPIMQLIHNFSLLIKSSNK